jgi:hypothetical protein
MVLRKMQVRHLLSFTRSLLCVCARARERECARARVAVHLVTNALPGLEKWHEPGSYLNHFRREAFEISELVELS